MIRRFTYGSPLETGAVIVPVPAGDRLPYFSVKLRMLSDVLTARGEVLIPDDAADRAAMIFTAELAEADAVYGLGETMRGMNKRGYRYTSYNTDDPRHRPDMPSLYSSHNFLVVDGEKTYGVFFDTPSRVTFDVDAEGDGKLTVTAETGDIQVFLVTPEEVRPGESAAYAVAKEFLSAIGTHFFPPLWAFGYGQSRWGYKNEKDLRTVAAKHREFGCPLDFLCMDIDYMDRYIDFTVNDERFPDLPGFVEEMKEAGLHLVPIIDAGIKEEPGNPTYEEGASQGYFCRNREGNYFRAAVWPGMTHFPDFFRSDVRAWFGACYKALTDAGITGFWNDMNEPAIFYSEYTQPDGIQKKAGMLAQLLPKKEENGHALTKAYQDYHHFTHRIGGREVLHHHVHNLYGALMTRASGRGLNALLSERYLLFSRSSYIGAHRYGGLWTGDNSSRWDHLKTAVCQMANLSMCGFQYVGTDIGGFNGVCTRELLARWLAFGVFTPLMRNHSAKYAPPQEIYRFSHPEELADVIALRYRLLPYLYSEFMKAALRQDMFFRPLAFDFPTDAQTRSIEDQLMVGQDIMIAPVMEKGAKGRYVYLPERMTLVRWKNRRFSTEEEAPGWLYVEVGLTEVVFFIRGGHAIPVGNPVPNTAAANLRQVRLLGTGTEYEQYVDDGLTKDVSAANIRRIRKKAKAAVTTE